VVQGGRSFGLTLKTAEGLCVVGEFVGQELQSNMATKLEVFRLVYHAHAPTADLAENAVMGNRLPHGLGRSGHWLDMLGGSGGKVNASPWCHTRRDSSLESSALHPLPSGVDDDRSVINIWSLPNEFLTGFSAATGITFIKPTGNLEGFVGRYAMGATSKRT